jgi:hypothetical protein
MPARTESARLRRQLVRTLERDAGSVARACVMIRSRTARVVRARVRRTRRARRRLPQRVDRDEAEQPWHSAQLVIAAVDHGADARAAAARRGHARARGRRGHSAGQYLLGRDIGAAPIVGSARIAPGSSDAAHRFHRGDVIVLTFALGPQAAAKALDQLLAGLARQGLIPVTFAQLVASSRSTGGAPRRSALLMHIRSRKM